MEITTVVSLWALTRIHESRTTTTRWQQEVALLPWFYFLQFVGLMFFSRTGSHCFCFNRYFKYFVLRIYTGSLQAVSLQPQVSSWYGLWNTHTTLFSGGVLFRRSSTAVYWAYRYRRKITTAPFFPYARHSIHIEGNWKFCRNWLSVHCTYNSSTGRHLNVSSSVRYYCCTAAVAPLVWSNRALKHSPGSAGYRIRRCMCSTTLMLQLHNTPDGGDYLYDSADF